MLAVGGAAGRSARALLLACLAGVSVAPAQPPAQPTDPRPVHADTTHPRVTIKTSQGSFELELYAERAPETVRRFLARQQRGLELCEARAHGLLVFGCAPFSRSGPPGAAPGKEPQLPEEVDAIAMGLDRQPVEVPQPIEWLWQQEIFPRYVRLQETERPIPAGLEALVEATRRRGTAALSLLAGKSRLWYLEQLGHRFLSGGSPQRFVRGAVGIASFWPGEGDERFLIALAPLPERDGRAVVFGQVVAGWDTLEAIARLPIDKSHRTLSPVVIEETGPGEGSTSPRS